MILLEQRRYADAEKYFRDALAVDPNDPFALYHLAVCELNQGKAVQALATIDRALAIDPEMANFHAFKALILVDLRRTKEALEASETALRIEPDSDFALTARAAAFLSKNEWATAEAAARKALEINPDNNVAATQLAHALRLQNRLSESADQTAYMLSQDPEDADNHSTAGWLALQSGKVKEAQEHFLEALRLDPNNESAKEGLKEAFRARNPIYRVYLNYCFFMQRFTQGKQWLIIIGLLFAPRLARTLLPPPLATAVVVLYFLFVLWVHVARAVGNLQICFDRFARHALDFGEKIEAALVGGGVVLGLPLFIGGIATGIEPLVIAGVTLIAAAFPMAYTFTNASNVGRVVFGLTGAFVYGIGAVNLIESVTGATFGSWVGGASYLALLAVVAVTWLCNVSALYRRR